MSPEVEDKCCDDLKCDIYSAAATILTLVSTHNEEKKKKLRSNNLKVKSEICLSK